jgi:hypothetical protein
MISRPSIKRAAIGGSEQCPSIRDDDFLREVCILYSISFDVIHANLQRSSREDLPCFGDMPMGLKKAPDILQESEAH